MLRIWSTGLWLLVTGCPYNPWSALEFHKTKCEMPVGVGRKPAQDL